MGMNKSHDNEHATTVHTKMKKVFQDSWEESENDVED